MKKSIFALCVFLSAVFSEGATNDIYSNEVVVKGWRREPVTFDTRLGKANGVDIPTLSESAAIEQMAIEISNVLARASKNLTDSLQPTRQMIEARKEIPVVMLVSAVSPENALERTNLTMCVISNRIVRTANGLNVTAWVYGNKILTSAPLMEAKTRYDYCQNVIWSSATWDGYGDETKSYMLDTSTGTYETYKLTFDVSGSIPTNLTLRLRPWVKIGKDDAPFVIGNRSVRVNGQIAMTTNSLSFMGQFMTTNNTPLTGMIPFADKGLFKIGEESEDDEEEDQGNE